MTKEWVTVQECIGLPGFPTTAPAMRKRLDDLSAGREDMKRKRTGGKAYEYHISILPKYAQTFFSQEEDTVVQEQRSNAYGTDMEEIWMMIFRLLTVDQQKDCIELFKNHGLHALLPSVVNGLASKEILQQRDLNENSPSAPNVSTQSKKAG
ncbi:hypothetical protein R5K90_002222 [Salmonella enterica]|nr:hypothetical protein [Salmonella enterica]